MPPPRQRRSARGGHPGWTRDAPHWPPTPGDEPTREHSRAPQRQPLLADAQSQASPEPRADHAETHTSTIAWTTHQYVFLPQEESYLTRVAPTARRSPAVGRLSARLERGATWASAKQLAQRSIHEGSQGAPANFGGGRPSCISLLYH